MFERVETAKLAGTSNQGDFELSPSQLVSAFGPPTPELWDSESLGAFYFQNADGRVFAVYHRAYDRSQASIAALRKSFWKQQLDVEFSIGAHGSDGVAAFKAWLATAVQRGG